MACTEQAKKKVMLLRETDIHFTEGSKNERGTCIYHIKWIERKKEKRGEEKERGAFQGNFRRHTSPN